MNIRKTGDSNSTTIPIAAIQVFIEKPAAEFLVNCAAKAAHNAQRIMSAEDWQEKRATSGNPARADILMAFDPQPRKETT